MQHTEIADNKIQKGTNENPFLKFNMKQINGKQTMNVLIKEPLLVISPLLWDLYVDLLDEQDGFVPYFLKALDNYSQNSQTDEQEEDEFSNVKLEVTKKTQTDIKTNNGGSSKMIVLIENSKFQFPQSELSTALIAGKAELIELTNCST